MNCGLKIFLRRAIENQVAFVQHQDARCEALYLFRAMGGKKDGFAGVMQCVQQSVEFICHLEVETRGRFITKHHRRVCQQSASDVHPLLQTF